MAALQIPTASVNNPARKGELASSKVLFGDYKRYALFAMHTRFDVVAWIVQDAHITDPVTGGPETIRQEDTPEAAIGGLL